MVNSVTRMLFSHIMPNAQGEGKGCVLVQTNVPEDAYYIPNPPSPIVDETWGITDWIWDHENKTWLKVPRAENDPRGPDDGSVDPIPVTLKPVTRRQLRLTLVRNGISLASVEALIAGMPEGLEKEEAQIEWADAQTFERNHPTLLLIAEALQLSPSTVDEMWLEAMAA